MCWRHQQTRQEAIRKVKREIVLPVPLFELHLRKQLWSRANTKPAVAEAEIKDIVSEELYQEVLSTLCERGYSNDISTTRSTNREVQTTKVTNCQAVSDWLKFADLGEKGLGGARLLEGGTSAVYHAPLTIQLSQSKDLKYLKVTCPFTIVNSQDVAHPLVINTTTNSATVINKHLIREAKKVRANGALESSGSQSGHSSRKSNPEADSRAGQAVRKRNRKADFSFHI